jgi:xylulokinase
MYLLGCDIGSSSVKASIVNAESGLTAASDFYPKEEAPIKAPKPGWAEQNPDDWWNYLKIAIAGVIRQANIRGEDVRAIGISYQMHGLTLVDKQQKVLRPSIIWCDSRAVPYGEQAFRSIGEEYCLSHLLNSPGNFTAAKLAWVKENEPSLFDMVYKFMLPGDFIAMRMTGEAVTTVSGLSEGIFWDFRENRVSDEVMTYFCFDAEQIPAIRPTFGIQGELLASVASELGLKKGTPVAYRAGDQPNNALSLNVLHPGEIAATAGTSGVVYGVNNNVNYDARSRVNTFAHVNHSAEAPRLGVLLCINGVGILNSWVKRTMAPEGIGYDALNSLAASVPIGSEGLSILPFGNGAERMLENEDTACSMHGINFNIHNRNHIARAAQEGIVFSFRYGMEIMDEMGIDIRVIRAGNANMFLSPVFKEALAGMTGAVIELYDTNGAVGAAKGAGIGIGLYASPAAAFASLKKIEVIEPDVYIADKYFDAYLIWKKYIHSLNKN